MNRRINSTILLTLALTWTVLAQTQSPMREGNWEVSMKMNMPGMKMDMPPMKATQCVTAEMIKDPQSAVPQGPGGGDCKISDYKVSGNTVTYTMSCTKPSAMTGVAEMKFVSPDAYTSTVAMEMNGQKMTVAYDAKRLGDCPKTK